LPVTNSAAHVEREFSELATLRSALTECEELPDARVRLLIKDNGKFVLLTKL